MGVLPKIIFIVPYRDRAEHKQFFSKYMEFLMEDYDRSDYELYFSHQCDNRPFNRGAMKNIGFLAIKQKYPNDYKNMTFVFNDVDTLPYTKNLLPYETTAGKIKHFYGFKFALGGIVSINGSDFEKMNGYPNLWGWSQEDNLLNNRAFYNKIPIDRSTFFPIGNRNILQFVDSVNKIISKKEILHTRGIYPHGLNSINNLKLQFKDEYINVYNFNTENNPNNLRYEPHNIIEESNIIQITPKERRMMNSTNRNLSMLKFI